jgi:hypothetical protein
VSRVANRPRALARARAARANVAGPRNFRAHPAVVDAPTPEALYAVSDIHGGYERFTSLLHGNGLIAGNPSTPSEVHWTGGNATLVVVGDLIDKGPNALDTIDMLRSLEASAAEAGGRVIVTMGNHEAEFFADPNNAKATGPDGFSVELRAAGIDPEQFARSNDPRATWLRNRPFAARVGSWFFAHAGDTAGRSLTELGDAIEMGMARNGFRDAEITGPKSILTSQRWFETSDDTVARNARALGVKHIAFGHNPNVVGPRGRIGVAYDAGLFRIDTGMSPDIDYGTGKLLRVETRGNHQVASALGADGKARTLWRGRAN